MVKIYHPTDKAYNGVRANVRFTNGVGETDVPSVIEWFKLKGFKVEDEKPKTKTSTRSKTKTKASESE